MSSETPHKLFFDRCLGGRRLRELLREKGVIAKIVLHDEVFDDRETTDLIWAEWAAKEGFIAFTHDLFRNEQEKRILSMYKGLAIILPSMPAEKTCETIIHAWSKIKHLLIHKKTGCYKLAPGEKLSVRWR